MLDRLRGLFAERSRPSAARPRAAGVVVAAGRLPLIREVRRWAYAGSYRQAVLLAYPTALRDADRGLRLPSAPGLTHPECLQRIEQAGEGRLAGSLTKLYELYRPVRYGPPSWETTSANVDDVVDILQDIYGHAAMWLTGARGARSARMVSGAGMAPEAPSRRPTS